MENKPFIITAIIITLLLATYLLFEGAITGLVVGEDTSIEIESSFSQNADISLDLVDISSPLVSGSISKGFFGSLSLIHYDGSTHLLSYPAVDLNEEIEGASLTITLSAEQQSPNVYKLESSAPDDLSCTRWIINQGEQCFGSTSCCELFSLDSHGEYNDSLYLSTANSLVRNRTIVQAQVLRANYSLDVSDSFSDIQFSNITGVVLDYFEDLPFSSVCNDACDLNNAQSLRITVESGSVYVSNLTYKKAPNSPPSFQTIPNITLQTSYTIDLAQYASDADKDNLSFSHYEAPGVRITYNGSLATIIPEENFSGITYTYFRANDSILSTSSNIVEIAVNTESSSAVILNQAVRWTKRIPIEEGLARLEHDPLNITVSHFHSEIPSQTLEILSDSRRYSLSQYETQKRIEQIESQILHLPNADISALAQQKRALEQQFVTSEIDERAPNTTALIISQDLDYVDVEYYTEAPIAIQSETERGKRVIISSDTHYENILAFTTLDDVPLDSISLYHLDDGLKKETAFTPYDTNGDQLIDYIEWVVPHLSNQTYEIEITILTVQSYPTVGGEWTISFTTLGRANLSIAAIDQTSYAEQLVDDSLTPNDLEILSLRCANTILYDKTQQIVDSQIRFNTQNATYTYAQLASQQIPIVSLSSSSYECNATSQYTVRVLTHGKHSQQISFGNEIGFAYNLADSVFYAPKITSIPQAGVAQTITIQNTSLFNDASLHFRKLRNTVWNTYNITSGSVTIPSSVVADQDIYEFYINDSSGNRFPTSNTKKLALSDGNEFIYDHVKSLTDNDTTSGYYCQPNLGTYSCQIDSIQANMIEEYSYAYWMSKNQTYLDIVHELATSDFDTAAGEGEATCNQAEADYNCSSQFSFVFSETSTGAKRQGSLITSLWQAYQFGANDTLREIASLYTNGSAQECDVWSSDFNCESADDQGSMIRAYWKAYEMTGLNRYREIANNLSAQGMQYNYSVDLARGYWHAYEMSGNQTYYQKASNLTAPHLLSCRENGCVASNHSRSISLLLNAYEQTRNYSYLRAAFDTTYLDPSSSCGVLGVDYRCENAQEQGLLASALWSSYHISPNQSIQFYFPHFTNLAEINNNLTLSVRFKGNISEPTLYYRKIGNESWGSANVSILNGSSTIPQGDLLLQGLYEYYFNDSLGNRFPDGNGTLRFSLTLGDSLYSDKAQSLTLQDPLTYCDPQGTNTVYNNYTCYLEYMQAAMIQGYSAGANTYANATYSEDRDLLSTSEIDPIPNLLGLEPSGFFSTCDHANSDVSCNSTNQNFPGNSLARSGAHRQSRMIASLWESVQSGSNQTVAFLAQEYADANAQECAVWSGVFNCSSSDDQGEMIYAYWNTYKMTGEHIYKEIAQNLSSIGVEMNDSLILLRGLLSGFSLTGNETYYTKAVSIAQNLASDCTSSGCIPQDQANHIISYWDAYLYTNDNTYLSAAQDKTLAQRGGSLCDPNDPTSSEFQCRYPNHQGLMSTAFWRAFSIAELNTNITFDTLISAEPNVSITDELNISCEVQNIGNFTVFNVSARLLLSSGLNTTGNETITLSELNAGQNATINWTIDPIAGGPQVLECLVTSLDGAQNSTSQDLIVNNLGSVFDISITHIDELSTGVGTSVEVEIANNVSYNLFNLTVELNLSSGINITTISTDGNASADNFSVNFTQLASSENTTINWTIVGVFVGQQDINITAFSQYGGFNQETSNISVLGGSFNASLTTLEEVNANTSFSLDLLIGNNDTNNLSLLSVNLTLSNETNITALVSNSSNTTISSDNLSALQELLIAGEQVLLQWNTTAASGGVKNFTVRLATPGSEVNVTTNVSVYYCGDNVCQISESCSSCTQDCGGCIDSEPLIGGGGSAITLCEPQWECSSWSKCEQGQRVRECIDTSSCDTDKNKPQTTQQCQIRSSEEVTSKVTEEKNQVPTRKESKPSEFVQVPSPVQAYTFPLFLLICILLSGAVGASAITVVARKQSRSLYSLLRSINYHLNKGDLQNVSIAFEQISKRLENVKVLKTYSKSQYQLLDYLIRKAVLAYRMQYIQSLYEENKLLYHMRTEEKRTKLRELHQQEELALELQLVNIRGSTEKQKKQRSNIKRKMTMLAHKQEHAMQHLLNLHNHEMILLEKETHAKRQKVQQEFAKLESSYKKQIPHKTKISKMQVKGYTSKIKTLSDKQQIRLLEKELYDTLKRLSFARKKNTPRSDLFKHAQLLYTKLQGFSEFSSKMKSHHLIESLYDHEVLAHMTK